MMDYEKAYKAMVQRAKELHKDGNALTKQQMEIVCSELAESEDERIRRCIEVGLTDVDEQRFKDFGTTLKECLAYLEKQKDIWGDKSKNIVANMLEDGIEGIQRELIEFLSNTINASWVDIIQSADAYAERIRNIIEKQKEQKPNIELIQKSWYMEGYHDREFNHEPKWIIKTGEEGLRYEENPKYGQIIEQKPIEPSDDELQRHQKELYDFKVFAAKQAKEHHISFVNDFEWNNFCDELLSFFYEKHTTDGKALLHVAEKSYQIGLRDGKMEQKPDKCNGCNNVKGCITCVDGDQWAHIEEEPANGGDSEKPNNQWSEEDEKMLDECVMALSNWRDAMSNYGYEVALSQRLIDWLKSLRPQPRWKPSEEQMEALSALNCHGELSYVGQQNQLISLQNDLKKLM